MITDKSYMDVTYTVSGDDGWIIEVGTDSDGTGNLEIRYKEKKPEENIWVVKSRIFIPNNFSDNVSIAVARTIDFIKQNSK